MDMARGRIKKHSRVARPILPAGSLCAGEAEGCRPCWRLAGSPSFFLRVGFSPLRGAEGAYRPMGCAHDGVPTQVLLRGSSDSGHLRRGPRLTVRRRAPEAVEHAQRRGRLDPASPRRYARRINRRLGSTLLGIIASRGRIKSGDRRCENHEFASAAPSRPRLLLRDAPADQGPTKDRVGGQRRATTRRWRCMRNPSL